MISSKLNQIQFKDQTVHGHLAENCFFIFQNTLEYFLHDNNGNLDTYPQI